MNTPLLTIAIPTFNRAYLLEKCLSSLSAQVQNVDEIELIVANNASTDNTNSIIEKYVKVGSITKYIKRSENIGPERNFADCFNEAKGKYFWIIGDDDLLLPNTLSKIMKILKTDDYGVIFLKESISYCKDEELLSLGLSEDHILKIKVHSNSIDFFKEYNYWATFITCNIINRSLIVHRINPLQFFGTYLIQLGWNIPSLFAANNNVIVYDNILGCKANNTGGYKLVTVFSKNYNFILNELIKTGIDRRIKPITKNEMYKKFFPHFMNNLLSGKSDFNNENHGLILFKEGWNYKSYWKYVFPFYAKYYVKEIFAFFKK